MPRFRLLLAALACAARAAAMAPVVEPPPLQPGRPLVRLRPLLAVLPLLTLAATPAHAAPPAEAAISLDGPVGAAWWVRPDLPWAEQPLVVVLPEPGASAATGALVRGLLAQGLAAVTLPEGAAVQAGATLAAAAEAGFAPERIGVLAMGATAEAGLKAAAGQPLVLIEPACAALEVPRPGALLVLTGAAAGAACPPPPPWPGLEVAALPGSPGQGVAAGVAAAHAAAWLCQRLAPCAEAAR
jgi:hypothetical protein